MKTHGIQGLDQVFMNKKLFKIHDFIINVQAIWVDDYSVILVSNGWGVNG
jgi:hypothetical protein